METQFTFPSAFFVTGTDTDVGKTFVCAVLMAGLHAHYWKPVGAGQSDGQWIKEKTGLPDENFFPESYSFKHHLSPHLASQLEDITIDIAKIKIPHLSKWQHLIVEGAGGLMVPINNSLFVIDLIKHLNLPVLVVARSTLGTINHTVLTVDKLCQKEIAVLGVVMNGPKNPNNRAAIEKYGQVPVLAEIEPVEIINAQSLKQIYDTQFTGNIYQSISVR